MQTTAPAAQAANASHTPGPWIWADHRLTPAQPDPDRSAVHSILDADGGYGFIGSDWRNTIAELEADRRLIAASPDLLHALQRLHTCMQAQNLEIESDRPTEDDYQACMAAATAAIAKATGQQGGAA
jgi:hypothetical protein